jgi:mono/diheme cytochrome c family protein
MKTPYLLAFALAAGVTAFACSSGNTSELGGSDNDSQNDPKPGSGNSQNPGSNADDTKAETPPGTTPPATTPEVPTNSPAGKALFIKTVFNSLAGTCSTCHGTTGPGAPWMLKNDVEGTYKVVFQRGYVVSNSLLLTKGVHGGAGPALTTQQATDVSAWIAQELKDGGGKSTPAVLSTIGGCFDRTKFDAIGLQTLTTSRRTDNNDPKNATPPVTVTPWNENQNNCTGCNVSCATCHTQDDASGFVMSIGSNVLPANNTFERSKLQPFISQYIGVSPTGEPIASNGLKTTGERTAKQEAYSHPLYAVPQAVQDKIDAFVNDAITKYKAGSCGQAPATAKP